MPSLMCEICGRRECIDPWKICGECSAMRAKCRKLEDRIRREFRAENRKLIGSSTPGMKQFGCSVHERRGRKLIRPVREDVFLEGSEDEPE